jgi:hypothetical protein
VGGVVTESGKPADRQTGLKLLREGVFEAGSGAYEFVYPYKKPG